MRILLFGATGTVGSALGRLAKEKSWVVAGTCHTRPQKELVPFDLSHDLFSDSAFAGQSWDYGVICSAISNIDQCKRDTAKSRAVNVEGTIRLADELMDEGICPVFLSSDYVFSGKTGGYTEESPLDPVSEYGRQKAEVEAFLRAHAEHSLTVRLSKAITMQPDDGSLLAGWYRDLCEERVVRCISGQVFCPTCIHDIAEALCLLMQERKRGLYQVCQSRPYDRVSLLREFAEVLGLSVLYEEHPVETFGFLDQRSRDTSMSPAKFIRETGYQFRTMSDCFTLFKQWANSNAHRLKKVP